MEKIRKSPHQTTDISRGDGPLIDKDHPSVVSALLRPGFEQRRDGPSVIGDEGQPLRTRLLQTSRVVSPKKLTVFPLRHTPDRMQSISALEATRDVWRDMLIEKELQHFSAFLLSSK